MIRYTALRLAIAVADDVQLRDDALHVASEEGAVLGLSTNDSEVLLQQQTTTAGALEGTHDRATKKEKRITEQSDCPVPSDT